MQISDPALPLGNLQRPSRILVVTLRRLGDVLVTTPLIRSLRRAYPDAKLDALVFRGSAGILAGNPDISNILTVTEKAGAGETLALVARLFRRYDLAISTQAGDKPTVFAWLAGRQRIGIAKPRDGWGWLKHRLLDKAVPLDLTVHRVVETQRLLAAAGVPFVPELVPPAGPLKADTIPARPYAVLHPNPKYAYKRWNAAGWRHLAGALAARGLGVVVTGGPDAEEKAYLDGLWSGSPTPVTRTDGQLGWPDLANLIGRAAVYVGTDTSMTHLAAATGAPTVAIYGPVDPRIMGPWPVGGLSPPWDGAGTVQARGNVWVVQNPASCPFHTLPCEKLGCDGALDSRAQCLDELTAEQVLTAVDAALAGPAKA